MLSLAARDVDDAADHAAASRVDDHADVMERQAMAMLVVGGVLAAVGTGILIWQSTRPANGTAALKLRVARERVLLEGRF